MLVEGRCGARGAEPGHADEAAAGPDPSFPAEAAGCLAGHPGRDRGRQHALPVGLVLLGEEIPARHAHDPGTNALGGERRGRVEADLHLAAGADEDAVGPAVGRLVRGGFEEHVGAPGHARGRAELRAVERRQILPAEYQDGRSVGPPHDHAIGLRHLVGIGRTEHADSGDRAGAGELLDRLVRRAILAEADRVVREDVDDPEVAQRRQPQRRLEIVEKHEECRAVRAEPRQREPIARRGHAMLADAEVEVAAAG